MPNPALATATSDGYAATRRLYDELDVTLATWRGDVLYSREIGQPQEPESGKSATWDRLDEQMEAALASLYRIEGIAPESRAAQVARSLTEQLNATRSAVDRLASARKQSRVIEGDPANSADAVASARAAERDAGDVLTADRQRLGDLIGELSSSV